MSLVQGFHAWGTVIRGDILIHHLLSMCMLAHTLCADDQHSAHHLSMCLIPAQMHDVHMDDYQTCTNDSAAINSLRYSPYSFRWFFV